MSEPTEPRRSIELEIEVAGTPEQVWRAVATGPGISSWYVPHVVEEREGGAATASFGDAPEMQVPGRVAAWEPPRRVVFDGGEDAGGLAFEWLVEGRGDRTCAVRLVNSGFGDGSDWDDQYDGMVEGWQLFLFNLQLHCRHFLGQHATSMLPVGASPLSRTEAWTKLCADLHIPESPAVGEAIAPSAGDGLGMAGTVVKTSPTSIALLLDEPAAGTAFLAVETGGEGCGVSIWSYLYGTEASSIIERDKPRWTKWLNAFAG
jgi:uncharacterized protein YndB with AHSA1/START domain